MIFPVRGSCVLCFCFLFLFSASRVYGGGVNQPHPASCLLMLPKIFIFM